MKGMLFAALGGASRAGMEVMDNQIKANSEEKKRVQSIADRRAELEFEMAKKVDYARSQEEAEAKGFERADARAAEIRDERGAREFKGGMGMLSNLEEMGISPDTALRTAQDRMTGGREVGAPGSVRKELTADFNTEVKTEKSRRDAEDKAAREDARDQRRADAQALAEDGRNTRLATSIDAAGERQSRTIAAAVGRGGGSGGGGSGAKLRSTKTNAQGEVIAIMSDGSTKPLGIQDQAFAKNVATLMAKMQGERKFSRLSEDELRELAANRLAGAQVDAAVDEPPAPKPVVPQSTKKDNGTTKLPAGMTAASVRAEAIARIKAAPGSRSGVIARMKELGLDTQGL